MLIFNYAFFLKILLIKIKIDKIPFLPNKKKNTRREDNDI